MPTNKPRFFERLANLFSDKSASLKELLELLRALHAKKIVDTEALAIIEGALSAAKVSVDEIMLPRHEMCVIDVHSPYEDILYRVNETRHSRFPVIDGDLDKIIGILLAKDLLRIHANEAFNLRHLLRKPVFIPESKRLNVLLREFRLSRNHMAIVIDEYAGVAGLVTIEDVLEHLVGDIEDEYDANEEESIYQDSRGNFYVEAQSTLEEFNDFLGAHLASDECATIGGFIVNHLRRVPRPRETVQFAGFNFLVTRADSRKIHSFLVTKT